MSVPPARPTPPVTTDTLNRDSDVVIGTMSDDARPPIVLQDAQDVTLDHVDATRAAGVPWLAFREIADLTVRNSRGVVDAHLAHGDTGAIAK